MNLIPRWAWLQAMRRAAHADAHDAADMGTAYGLDASFDALSPLPPTTTPTAGAAPWRSERTGLPRRPGS